MISNKPKCIPDMVHTRGLFIQYCQLLSIKDNLKIKGIFCKKEEYNASPLPPKKINVNIPGYKMGPFPLLRVVAPLLKIEKCLLGFHVGI